MKQATKRLQGERRMSVEAALDESWRRMGLADVSGMGWPERCATLLDIIERCTVLLDERAPACEPEIEEDEQ